MTVIDNASEDGSGRFVATEFPWVQLIESDRNLGYGPAANLALDHAETDWLIAANADVTIEPRSVQRLIEVGQREERIAVVGPHLVTESGLTQDSAFEFPTLRRLLGANLGVHRINAGLRERLAHASGWDPGEESMPDWVLGAFMLIRRRAFEQVGGFDSQLWLYAEDLDLCWRLHRAGWATKYSPAGTVVHLGGAATTAAFGKAAGSTELLHAHYRWLLLRRGRLAMWSALLITASGAILRLAGYGVLRVIGVQSATKRQVRVRAWLQDNLRAGKAAQSRTLSTGQNG